MGLISTSWTSSILHVAAVTIPCGFPRSFRERAFTMWIFSEKARTTYRNLVGADAEIFDMIPAGRSIGRRFDVAAMVFGGLYHCVSDLSGTIRTLAARVRREGLLLMYQPNSRYVLEGLRTLWYRWDSTFEAETESARDHDGLSKLAARYFQPIDWRSMERPAYFLIYNSMIFSIPKKLKHYLPRFSIQ
jgi:hypothetical protein